MGYGIPSFRQRRLLKTLQTYWYGVSADDLAERMGGTSAFEGPRAHGGRGLVFISKALNKVQHPIQVG